MADASRSEARRGAADRTRVPPHDLNAEESLLGAMLLSPMAIAAAVEIVDASDFYKPAHGHIFDAITTLYGAGEPADPVTVADQLRRANLLEHIGGQQVLVDLMTRTPAITNAAHYARIVEENALLRRLIGVAGEIAEMGYELPDDVAKAIDRAEAMVYEVAQRRVRDSTVPLHDLLEASLTHLEQLYERGDAITGLPTGYVDLDELLSGLQPSSLVVVGARPSMGKCVAWDTPIPDPLTGEVRTAAELYVRGMAGERVTVASLGPDGSLCAVEPSAFIDDGVKPVFRVRTRLGRMVRTTITHPFLTPQGWQPLERISIGSAIAVPESLPIFGDQELDPADVAVLAHLLAHGEIVDGEARFTSTNRAVIADLLAVSAAEGVEATGELAADGRPSYRLCGRVGRACVLAVARLHGLRHGAPARMPEAVRRLPRPLLALFLHRLLGITASVRAAARGCGRIHACFPTYELASDVAHLLLRFGITVTLHTRRGYDPSGPWSQIELDLVEAGSLRRFCQEIGLLGQDAMVLVLAGRAGLGGSSLAVGASDPWPTGSPTLRGPAPMSSRGRRRDLRHPVLEHPAAFRAHAVRWDEVVEISFDGYEQVYDFTVPGTHNFVAGDVFVHNTAFALGLAAHAAVEAHRPVLFFSLEMGHLEITQRLLCAEARVDSQHIRTGRLQEQDWTKISHAIGRLGEAPLFIDDNPNVTVMEIRAKARRLKSKTGDLGLVVVDYLQLMSGRGNAENRQVEISEISRGLKVLARELECPVVALSQLSRALEMRADKRPMLADLRESGAIEQDADVVIFLYRDEVYNPETPDIGTAEVIVAKHRNGPTGHVRLAFLGRFTRFANMARGV